MAVDASTQTASSTRQCGVSQGMGANCRLLAELLFLPIFSTLLLALDCTCTADQCTLDADKTVACWEGWDLAQAFVTLLVMMMYIWLELRA